MKKLFLILSLIFAMAVCTAPAIAGTATAFDESLTGSYWSNGGSTFDAKAGWSVEAGTEVYRLGTATGKSWWFLPAFALAGGESFNLSQGNGSAFSLNFPIPNGIGGMAGSNAWSHAESSGLEAALAGILNAHTTTEVLTGGYASQSNGSGNQSQIGSFLPSGVFAGAGGGNSNIAMYSAGMSDSGSFLSGSIAGGEANVNGFTFVKTSVQGVSGSWSEAKTFGITGNFGEAFADPNGLTEVAGSGHMETGTHIVGQNPNNYAGTHTNSSFAYDNFGGSQAHGFGIAGGWGQSNITKVGNGVTVTSRSGSFSVSK